MTRKGVNVVLSSYDDLFETDNSRADAQLERIQNISIHSLIPFKDHPFKVIDDDAMTKMVDSIKEFGILVPVLARPLGKDRYEIISGHRRHHAADLAGMENIPVIVRDMDDDAATILMVDSNLQRENILPSERAFSYRMKLEALKHQGKRTDLTSDQDGPMLSNQEIGKYGNDSMTQVKRYIRLTNLIPELLNMADEKKISFNSAVELSYLTAGEQKKSLKIMGDLKTVPSVYQAQRLKRLSQNGSFTEKSARKIINKPITEAPNCITFPTEQLKPFFPQSYTAEQIREKILEILIRFQTKSV